MKLLVAWLVAVLFHEPLDQPFRLCISQVIFITRQVRADGPEGGAEVLGDEHVGVEVVVPVPVDGDVVSDDVLHVPVDRPVRVVMRAKDVIHSFYIPAFRVKQDIVPGRYTKLWFTPTKPGVYRMFCAEYCGKDHSMMKTTVVVHPPGGYERYIAQQLDEQSNIPPAQLGKKLYQQRGCAGCHSLDGSPLSGPSFKGLFGKNETLTSGSVLVDENYLRESILDPNAKVVKGFQPVMPSFKGQLSDKQLDGLIEYIKTIK